MQVGADALGHCSDAIRANPEVVRLVCGQNCNGLRWAHPSLQANRSLVMPEDERWGRRNFAYTNEVHRHLIE